MKRIIAYLGTCLAGLMLAYNSNVFTTENAKAVPLETVVLPQLKQNDFKLKFNLSTGESIVESNVPVSTDITVEHPTKIVEKVVYKQAKKEVIYKTFVMFPLKEKEIEPFEVQSVKPICSNITGIGTNQYLP